MDISALQLLLTVLVGCVESSRNRRAGFWPEENRRAWSPTAGPTQTRSGRGRIRTTCPGSAVVSPWPMDHSQGATDPGLEPCPRPLPRIRAALGPGTLRDCTAIAVVALLLAVVLRPFQGTPFIDDWVYSWSVQHLLETHEWLFPELVGNPIATQVLWGALFCLPFGFSLSRPARVDVGTRRPGRVRAVPAGPRVRRHAAFRANGGGGPRVLSDFLHPVAHLHDRCPIPGRHALVSAAVRSGASPQARRTRLGCGCGLRPIGGQPSHRRGCRRRDDRHAHFPHGPMGQTHPRGAGAGARRAVRRVAVVWTRARVFTSADITWLPNGPQQRLASFATRSMWISSRRCSS